MVTGADILRVATREIGYHEKAYHHNKYGEWYGLDGKPWCMEFVQWVYHNAGLDLPFRTASCGTLLRWYQERQPDCISKTPISGCVVIFDLPNTDSETDHTGLFVQAFGDKITTIDGNTSCGNDANGGWVQQRQRSIKKTKPVYIIPRGLAEVVDIDKLISQMTDEQAYKLYCKAEKHMSTLPLPTSWDAAGELREAKLMGITDGESPMIPTPRYQTAIMCKRTLANSLNYIKEEK